MMRPAHLQQLMEVASSLEPGQVELLLEMALAIGRPTTQRIARDSDIAVPAFATNFANRLKIYHATNEEPFKKKTFEYAFKAASCAAGRDAEVVASPTNPGADVLVDGVKFSLKTEAARGIHENYITISKLMEARWIRECRTGQDFLEGIRRRIVPHLQRYERVVTLRAFVLPDRTVRYDLIEIPLRVLLAVQNLSSRDFGQRTTNGSTSADVSLGNRTAFRLRLDGSVEKVTIASLDVGVCRFHASWTVPILIADEEYKESE